MFSKELICYNCQKKGHTANKCPEKKKEFSKKKIAYKNKKGKVNYFDLPSSCDELISSDLESENELNFADDSSSEEEEYCREPYCTNCNDCNCSDPDVCKCNMISMMKSEDDEISRNLFTQMMAASDQQLKEMYRSMLTDHLSKKTSKSSSNRGYVPPTSLFSVEALTRQFKNEEFGEDLPQTLPVMHMAIKELRKTVKENKRLCI